MIAEIIPLLRLPRSLGVFDYQVPPEIEAAVRVGIVVRIPFRGRKATGIVVALKPTSSLSAHELESITRLAHDIPLLDASALRRLLERSEEASVSPALYLRGVLPAIPERLVNVRESTPRFAPRGFTIPKKFVTAVGAGLSAVANSHDVFLQIDDNRVLLALLMRFAMDAHRLGRHLRILTPYHTDVLQIAHTLNQYGIPADRSLSTLGKSETWKLWQACRDGRIPVLVGTRPALFFPLPAKSTVVLLDEDASDWKQGDINPRYDARTILKKILAEDGRRVLIAPFVRPEMYHAIQERSVRKVDLRVHGSPSVRLIDLHDHIRAGNRTALSDTLIEALKGSRKALLFVHRKGSGTVLRCRDCQFLFQCSDCELPLSVHRTHLRCIACKKKSDLPLSCPSCRGTNLVSYGAGTERVEEELTKRFPEARIVRLDREDAGTSVVETAQRTENADIIVGTVAMLRGFSLVRRELPSFDLLGIVEADSMLHRPDFRAHEKLARIIVRLGALAARGDAPFYIQTAFPELQVWQAAQDGNENFLIHELAERKALHYPPFWRLAKIIVQHKNQKDAAAQAKKILVALREAMRTHPEIELVGPYAATPPKIRGEYHELILVRFPPAVYPEVKPYLAALPNEVIVDLDTIDVLR